MRAACKPSSVPTPGHPEAGDGHSSTRRIATPLERFFRTWGGPPWAARQADDPPDSILLQVGFTGPPCHHGAPVSSYLTLSPLPPALDTRRCRPGRRSTLCGTGPWGRPRWPLASTLPCGARTFLPSRTHEAHATGDHPVYSHSASPHQVGKCGARVKVRCLGRAVNHRDTEDAEGAQRADFIRRTLCAPSVLSVSLWLSPIAGLQPTTARRSAMERAGPGRAATPPRRPRPRRSRGTAGSSGSPAGAPSAGPG